MSRKLAVLLSVLASCMAHAAVRAQSVGAEFCPAGSVLEQAVSAPSWGWLQWALMALCLVLFVVAYTLILWVTLRHRRRSPQAKWWRDSRLADMLWTLLPLAFVVVMLWPMFKPMLSAKPVSPSESQALLRSADGQTAGAAMAADNHCQPAASPP